MEGEDCQAISTDLHNIPADNLLNSECEPSPGTPPPPGSSSCPSDDSDSSPIIITYDREFLLSRQFTPLALKPDAEKLLLPDYVLENNGSYGIFNINHCYYSKSKPGASIERKELGSECFRMLVDANPDVLRPQRKSFVSGCQMKSSAGADSGDKSNGLGKSNGSSQRRNSESSDRPRSVPTVERKVGSGRIPMERSDSRGSTDKSGPISRDKSSRSQNTADKLNNWRHRKSDEENSTSSTYVEGPAERHSYREPRAGHHSQSYHGRRYNNDANPEWLNESVTQTDTIELIGFDGHQEKIDKREKKEKKRKKKEVIKSQSNTDEELLVRPIKAASSEDISQSESEKTENIFDFDAFMATKNQTDVVLSSTDTPSSRFSRWFIKENGSSATDEFGVSDNTSNYLPGSLEEDLQVSANIDSLVHDILSIGDDDIPVDPVAPVTPAVPVHSNSGGNLILQMLQQSSKSSSDKAPAASPLKPTQKADSQLPPALTKLLSSSATTKPCLPAEYKTLEELEASMKPVDPKPVVKSVKDPTSLRSDLNHQIPHAHNRIPSPKSKPKQSQQDMTAFNKLVGMLKDTGELNKSVPKMPEVVTKDEPPNPLKKLLESNPPPTQPHVAAAGDIPPNPLHNYSRQSGPAPVAVGPQAGMSAPLLLPHHHQMATTTSIATMGVGINNALFANQGLVHPALGGGGGAPVNVPSMAPMPSAQPLNMAAFQVPVNPIIQQTIHHSQKVPSPIMFGNQPPIHIVAPAPIHPIGGSLVSQSQALYGQHPVSSCQQPFEQFFSHSSLPVSKSQSPSVATMAFTPTSVMRKRANDKVEERHKQGENNSQSRSVYSPASQEPFMPQAQHMNMRPIVKNNGPTSVADQMRRLMEEQNQGRIGQSAMQPSYQFTQHQPVPMQQQFHQTGPLLANIGNSMNGLHQPHHQQQVNPMFPQHSINVQQQLNLGADVQLARRQHQQMMARPASEKPSPDNLTKWFCGSEIASQQKLPLPKHANLLTLEDIEH